MPSSLVLLKDSRLTEATAFIVVDRSKGASVWWLLEYLLVRRDKAARLHCTYEEHHTVVFHVSQPYVPWKLLLVNLTCFFPNANVLRGWAAPLKKSEIWSRPAAAPRAPTTTLTNSRTLEATHPSVKAPPQPRSWLRLWAAFPDPGVCEFSPVFSRKTAAGANQMPKKRQMADTHARESCTAILNALV
jgi:hypothetical protein